ncbi:hypothetical protein RUM44_005529 [Polyplax serrata]|uniref:Glucosylceramidase n=1 Tax=Polyplax serrata TaxID=468196 RepID=A0ABR1ADN2_POLSC
MFNVYKSDSEGARFAFSKKKLATWINPRSVKVSVNSSELYQKVFGFGGSLSDAAALNIHSLGEQTKDNLLASYFSELGIEYNIIRIPIGGNVYSERIYTLDDFNGDISLFRFNLSFEDVTLRIPDLHKIQKLSRNGIQIVGTAWTAPPWMKTNGDYKGFGVLKEEMYPLWSKYHLRFLEEYEKHGLSFWAITTGYQPSSGFVPFYPYNCMGWTPFSQGRWISENLGPDLRGSKYNKTKIIVLDDSRFFLPWWPKMRLVDLTHAEFPEKFIINTEASFNKWKTSSGPVLLGSWERAEEYADSIINDLNHWFSGWMDANLVLDLHGGPSWGGNFADAAIIVNKSANEFYKQPMFYAMGHFSKFIPWGSFRIGVKVSKPCLKATGFRTPQGNVVIVMINKKNYDFPVTIVGAKKGNANIYVKKKSIVTVIFRDKKLPLNKKIPFNL